MDANDGHPPDTTEALENYDRENHGSMAVVATVDQAPPSHQMQSYSWTGGNSCFSDVGMALWFACYEQWNEPTRKQFLKLLPTDSAMAAMFYHFQRRLELVRNTNNPSSAKYQQVSRDLRVELELGQTVARHWIFSRLKIYSNSKAYGCAVGWLERVVQAVPNTKVDEYFGIKYTLQGRCSAAGSKKFHISSTVPSRPELVFNILCNDIDATRRICGPSAALHDHLEHIAPRCTTGTDVGPLRQEYLHMINSTPCSNPKCNKVVAVSEVIAYWPQILHVRPETLQATPASFQNREPLPLPRNLALFDSTITYELVGRIHYSTASQHYTCDRILGNNHIYQSDDMICGGDFIDIGPTDDKLAELDFTVCLLVYNRTSEKSTSCRSIEEIKEDYSHHDNYKGRQFDEDGLLVESNTSDEEWLSAVASTPFSSQALSPTPAPSPTQTAPTANTQILPPTHIDCLGCGLSGKRFDITAAEVMQCSDCQTWLHTMCMDQPSLMVTKLDGEWVCPNCQDPPVVYWDASWYVAK